MRWREEARGKGRGREGEAEAGTLGGGKKMTHPKLKTRQQHQQNSNPHNPHNSKTKTNRTTSNRRQIVATSNGADKVSIGGDAVDAAEAFYASGGKVTGGTAIEQISSVYGKQAVVVRR